MERLQIDDIFTLNVFEDPEINFGLYDQQNIGSDSGVSSTVKEESDGFDTPQPFHHERPKLATESNLQIPSIIPKTETFVETDSANNRCCVSKATSINETLTKPHKNDASCCFGSYLVQKNPSSREAAFENFKRTLHQTATGQFPNGIRENERVSPLPYHQQESGLRTYTNRRTQNNTTNYKSNYKTPYTLIKNSPTVQLQAIEKKSENLNETGTKAEQPLQGPKRDLKLSKNNNNSGNLKNGNSKNKQKATSLSKSRASSGDFFESKTSDTMMSKQNDLSEAKNGKKNSVTNASNKSASSYPMKSIFRKPRVLIERLQIPDLEKFDTESHNTNRISINQSLIKTPNWDRHSKNPSEKKLVKEVVINVKKLSDSVKPKMTQNNTTKTRARNKLSLQVGKQPIVNLTKMSTKPGIGPKASVKSKVFQNNTVKRPKPSKLSLQLRKQPSVNLTKVSTTESVKSKTSQNDPVKEPVPSKLSLQVGKQPLVNLTKVPTAKLGIIPKASSSKPKISRPRKPRGKLLKKHLSLSSNAVFENPPKRTRKRRLLTGKKKCLDGGTSEENTVRPQTPTLAQSNNDGPEKPSLQVVIPRLVLLRTFLTAILPKSQRNSSQNPPENPTQEASTSLEASASTEPPNPREDRPNELPVSGLPPVKEETVDENPNQASFVDPPILINEINNKEQSIGMAFEDPPLLAKEGDQINSNEQQLSDLPCVKEEIYDQDRHDTNQVPSVILNEVREHGSRPTTNENTKAPSLDTSKKQLPDLQISIADKQSSLDRSLVALERVEKDRDVLESLDKIFEFLRSPERRNPHSNVGPFESPKLNTSSNPLEKNAATTLTLNPRTDQNSSQRTTNIGQHKTLNILENRTLVSAGTSPLITSSLLQNMNSTNVFNSSNCQNRNIPSTISQVVPKSSNGTNFEIAIEGPRLDYAPRTLNTIGEKRRRPKQVASTENRQLIHNENREPPAKMRKEKPKVNSNENFSTLSKTTNTGISIPAQIQSFIKDFKESQDKNELKPWLREDAAPKYVSYIYAIVDEFLNGVTNPDEEQITLPGCLGQKCAKGVPLAKQYFKQLQNIQ